MTDCVGVCTYDDVYYATEADRLTELVRTVLDDFDHLALSAEAAATDAPLVLAESAGVHSWWYESVGLGMGETQCARDCALLSGYTANASLCTTGMSGVDVLVVVRAPHVIEEVAAAASACHHDAATGRPNVVVISWHQPLAELLYGTMEELVEQYGSIVRHELMHGLGFLLSEFRKADLVERRTMTDLDGAVDENVWSFRTGTLAHTAAMEHFACDDPAMPLPLMRHPEFGVDQHWSTLVMRDDLMAYGVRKSTSAITLGAMADLPYYVVNFNRSECLRWGKAQGCEFVTTRCGAMTHDHNRSVPVAGGAGSCRGLDTWWLYADDLLDAKCGLGATPCTSDAFDAAAQTCTAMCASDEAAVHACVVPNATLVHRYHDARRRRDDDDAVRDVLLWTQVAAALVLAWAVVINALWSVQLGEFQGV